MKRLYRSMTDKMIAGICAGLGQYFGIAPLLVRIVFVLAIFLTGGLVIPAYLLGIWVIPTSTGGGIDIEIQQIAVFKKNLSNDERMQFDIQFASQRKNPTTALILGLFLGMFGIDRFYIGHTGLGVGKLLTLGGLLVWQIVDWFLIMGATRGRNIQIAQQIHDTLVQIRS